MKKISAYAYLRVSGKGQISGHGFERQLKEISRYCENSNYQIVKVFKEQISGTFDEENRPEMGVMIADILSDGCNTVIVEDLSRLAREYRIQENILIYLASKGIHLIAANTGEDITEAIESDPMRKALVQIQGVFGELDKSLLVRKLRKAREKVRKEEGRCEGAKPYGTLEGESGVLKIIKRLRRKPRNSERKRMTYHAIAESLNRSGLKPRRGDKWTAPLVYNVLKPNQRRINHDSKK
jgi:DNA invertase Pin-like site-specific DNA recombinase